MNLSPESFEETIGLGRIRARLKEHVLGETGVRAVDQLTLESDRHLVELRLRVAGELQACLVRGEQIPFRACEDLTPILQSARPQGAALSPEMIMEVQRAAQTARHTRSFFLSRVDTLPTVADRWGALTEEQSP